MLAVALLPVSLLLALRRRHPEATSKGRSYRRPISCPVVAVGFLGYLILLSTMPGACAPEVPPGLEALSLLPESFRIPK